MLFVTACTEQAPRIAKYTDLYAVKGTDSLFLDRYTAVSVEQDDARPCLVFVFGGGFIAGERDAERYLPFFHYMVNQGYDVVSIDYRLGLKQVVASGDLSPENMMLGMTRTISMAVEDLYDATAFIVDKADEWVSTPRRSWPAGRVRERSPCCTANTPLQRFAAGATPACRLPLRGYRFFRRGDLRNGRGAPLGIAACADDAFSRRCGCERTV